MTPVLRAALGFSGRLWSEIPLPIIAIGGITTDNIPLVMEAGAYGVAVISAVCCQSDPLDAARCLRGLLEAKRHA